MCLSALLSYKQQEVSITQYTEQRELGGTVQFFLDFSIALQIPSKKQNRGKAFQHFAKVYKGEQW